MDVTAWLHDLGLGRYGQAFRDNEVDSDVLPELTDSDLEKLGIPLGHRKKLLRAIAGLAAAEADPRAAPGAISSAPRAPEAERRQLSVLFCDLVGSTELAARLDPEDMSRVIRAYQDCCTKVVERWGGHVAKYMGDGVLAYFGWPQAHEDEAERAVRAGLAITAAVARLETPAGEALAARVGIATGLVMVGELIGEGAAREQTVVGETPNLAARLQVLAAPGSVVISQATRRLVGGLFELADLGPQRLKGFAEPLSAFRVEGEGRAEGRFEALHGEHLTPLVGREHELGILLERWAWARDGDGQVVLLAGEPGIGKSRMLRTLRERLGDEPHTRLSHYCSPHHTNSALYPVIDLLERAARLERAAPPEAQLAGLEAALAGAREQLDDVVPLLAALLGLPTGERYPALTMAPEVQKRRTMQALLDQLAALAARQPVLTLYEDVHWIDPSTLELLGLVIERIQRLPVLAVITFRPEFQPPWAGHAHVTALTMSRLGRRQGADLVGRVTGDKPLPATIVEQIVARTDGVPLFVEELTKTVLESCQLTDAGDRYELSGRLPLAIPATLHDSLMARLDRLAPIKEVAQTAAVIGRAFPHDLLSKVSSLPEAELDAALDQLVQAELIFQRRAPPQAAYSFKHALVQDAAYQSLLKSKRRQLHARVAEVLERWFANSAEHQPELLAHHLTEAGLDERAAERWQTAGEKAAARSAYREALAHLQQGLEVVTQAGDEPWCARREIGLQNAIGVVLPTVRGFVPEAKQAYERARELARSVNDRESLFKATWGLWLISTRKPRFETAAQLSDELLAAVEQEPDEGLALQAHHAAWTTGWKRGEPETARRHAEIGVRLYRADQHHRLASVYGGHDAGVCCRYTTALANWLLGYPDGAVGRGRESLALAREVRHPYSLTLAFTYVALLHEFRREPDVVVGHVEALTDLSSEQGFPLRATAGRLHEAWLLLMHGEIDAAARQIAGALATEEALGSRMMHPYFLGCLVEAYLRAGRPDDGLATVERAFDAVREGQERWWEAELHRLHGELYLARRTAGDRADPEACFRRALTVARDQHARSLELRAATSLARLWAAQGRRADAHDLLAPVYRWFTEGFDTPDLKDAKALLDELK